MARNGTVSWRLVAACVGIFALVLGAAVLIRVLKSPAEGSSPSAASTSPGSTAPAASTSSVIAPHLIVNVPAGQAVRSLVFRPDGKTLADELSSGVVQLRDAATGAVLGSLGALDSRSATDRMGDGSSLAFSPDGKTLAVGVGSDVGFASKVELWNVAARHQTGEFPVTAAEVFSLAFSPDGKTLAVAGGKTLVLHTMATGASVSIPDDQQAYQGDAWYVSFSADGKTLAVANDEGLVRLWDVASARFTTSVTINPAAHYAGPPGGTPSPLVEAALISPDAWSVAVGGSIQGYHGSQAYQTPMVWLWQPGTGKYVTLTNNVTSQEDDVESGALNPAGQLFATGDDYGEIQLWNTATDAAAATFYSPAGNDLMGSLAFSPSGRVLASASNGSSGSAGGSIQLWDVYGAARSTAACGAGSGPRIAYVTAAAVMTGCGTGAPASLASLPAGAASVTMAWSQDGQELAWVTGTTLSVAQASTGAVRSWPCAGCSGVAFLGDQAVTAAPTAGGGQAVTAVPYLTVFPASGSAPPKRVPVTGISGTGTDTDFLLMGTVSPTEVVAAYGGAGGSDLGGYQLLYHLNAAGEATQYGHATLTGSGVQVGQGVLQAAYGPDGWVAQQTATLSDGTVSYSLTISRGSTQATVSGATAFAWAP